ncbi:MAG: cytochrome c oxidase accessory protein CcoG, partial [Gammaproteobacteria bacterium]
MDDATLKPARPAAASDVEQSLYEKRQKVYPREVHGTFAALRVSAVAILLGLFYSVCWLRWDGHQAVLFDLPARKFYVFGLTFWPQDFLLLTLLLMLAALSLFFFTALAGRLWCGYACPQTVWTEVFLWMERKIEGNRQQQMKLDKAPWSARKLRIKATKQLAWITFSLWTGFTFVAYFTPATELLGKTASLSLGPWETFWMLFYGFATYGNAGFMREQVCKYMCPYARFQSAMFDKDTLIVSYDQARGEPRGSRRQSADPKELGLGDCINCTMCVQ